MRKQTRIRWIQATLTSIVSPRRLVGLLGGKISARSHLGIQKRALCSSGRAPASLAACLSRSSLSRSSSLYRSSSTSYHLTPSSSLSLSLLGARARAYLGRVSACTYIRYLCAYIWVPIYRYQMVNERVDARSGRPQLAATQSFVYRGAVCATAHTGWPRSVDIFFSLRAPEHEIGQPIGVG